MSHRRIATLVTVLCLALVAAGAAPAAAKRSGKAKRAKPPKPAVTKIDFKLDENQVAVGDEVTSTLKVTTRSGRTWAPLSGAQLSVLLDGVDAGSLITGDDGTAALSLDAGEPGEHTIKVLYAGDATHKKAKRAQEFETSGTWYADADADGFGDGAAPTTGLEQPEGTVDNADDCDDADAAVNPDATEVPANSVDDNCDGTVDEEQII